MQPHFDYDDCGITLSTKIQKLQNRAIRVLTFSNFDADAKSLLENLGWNDLANNVNFKKR